MLTCSPKQGTIFRPEDVFILEKSKSCVIFQLDRKITFEFPVVTGSVCAAIQLVAPVDHGRIFTGVTRSAWHCCSFTHPQGACADLNHQPPRNHPKNQQGRKIKLDHFICNGRLWFWVCAIDVTARLPEHSGGLSCRWRIILLASSCDCPSLWWFQIGQFDHI